MTRPQALFALALAATPWLLAFAPKPRNLKRAQFAPLFLIASRQARRRRDLRRIVTAAARSLLIAALVLLWAEPDALAPTLREARSASPPAAQTQPALRVLVVDAAPSLDDSLNAADYLVAAFKSRGDAQANVERRELLNALADPPQREAYDVVFLADLESPTDDVWAALDAFLAGNDRAAVLWVGDRAAPEAWNDAFAKRGVNAEARRLEIDPATPPTFRSARRADAERLFARRFPDFENSGLDALPIARAIPCYVSQGDVFLRDARTNAPIFTRIAPRLFWFGASPTQNAGALGVLPSFPALAEEVARVAVDRSDAQSEATRRERGALNLALWAIVALAAIWECAFARPRERKPD